MPVTQSTNALASNQQKPTSRPVQVEELPSFVPAPKSLITDRGASDVATVNTGAGVAENAILTSLPKPVEASLKASGPRTAQLRFAAKDDVLKVGEKRQFAIEMSSDIPLGMAVLALRFDPRVVKIHAVSAGTLLPSKPGEAPPIGNSIDPSGVCLISISTLNGKTPIKGAGALVWLEVEAVAAGNAVFSFDKNIVQVVATDARDVLLDIKPGTAIIKQ
jgi:hypothetical protein